MFVRFFVHNGCGGLARRDLLVETVKDLALLSRVLVKAKSNGMTYPSHDGEASVYGSRRRGRRLRVGYWT